MLNEPFLRYLVAAVLWASIGCGNSNSRPSDAGTGFSTGLDPHKQLVGLAPSEKQRLCADVNSYFSSTFIPDSCQHAALEATEQAARTEAALTDADLQDSCASAYAKCLVSADAGAFVPGQDAAAPGGLQCDLSMIQPSCSASVADFGTCLSDANAAYEGLPACSAVTRDALTALVSDGGLAAAYPPVCAVIDGCLASPDGGTE